MIHRCVHILWTTLRLSGELRKVVTRRARVQVTDVTLVSPPVLPGGGWLAGVARNSYPCLFRVYPGHPFACAQLWGTGSPVWSEESTRAVGVRSTTDACPFSSVPLRRRHECRTPGTRTSG